MTVRDSQGAIAAVVGVAFEEEREIPHAEVSRLSNEAATLIPLSALSPVDRKSTRLNSSH